MMKNYLLKVLERCSEEQTGQDAVEWAIVIGHVTLTGDLEKDVRAIMGEPGNPDSGQYDSIIEAYQRHVQQNNEILVESYRESGLLEEILRPRPVALDKAA